MKRKIIINKLSKWAQNFFLLDGKPFSLAARAHLDLPYNHNKKKTLFLFSRQAEKSTTLAAKSLTRSLIYPFFKTLYVAPREKQVKQFVSQKLGMFCNSPMVMNNFINKTCSTGLFYKTFTNGSDYTLKSAFLSAESARGVSADSIYIDEFQDILRDHLPVIESSLQHAKSWARYREYAGTPKSLQNSIEFEWRRSNQYEWAIKCQGCNRHNILGKKNIGKDFLICSFCGKQIYPHDGQWVCTNREGTFPGFRICYLMVPWAIWRNPDDASEPGVIQMLEDWSDEKFLNEVLAISADSANVPLTLDELRAASEKVPILPELKKYDELVKPVLGNRPVKLYAGIDWGTSEENKSATVLTIGGFFPNGVFRVVYMKKYSRGVYSEIEEMDDIEKMILKFNVHSIGSDWGFGYIQNATLNLKFPGRVKTLYSSGSAGDYITYTPKRNLFVLSKPLISARLIDDIKRRNIRFFDWDENSGGEGFVKFSSDFLALRREYDLVNRKTKYFHQPGDPDDCFYSVNYCYICSQIDAQNFLIKDVDYVE